MKFTSRLAKERRRDEELAAMVSRAREDLGMTQAGFATMLGVSVTTVARWEGGTREPEKWTLIPILLKLKPGPLASMFEARIGRTREEMLADLLGNGYRGTDAKGQILLKKADDPELLQYFDLAVGALNLLYETALAGRSGAKTVLRDEAERLVKRGAQWRDAKYGLKKA
jgi:transcriptional regulator with XRE-family HTH domain